MAEGPDFQLDEAQEEIVRLAREVLGGHPEPPERAWKALGQAGLLTLAVPAELGGSGLGVVETGLLLAEIGRHAVAVPALSTLALGVLPVTRWGGPDQQRELLAGVGEGAVLTAALAEPADPMPAVPRTAATADWTLTGTKIGVPYAEQAHRILVPVALATGGVGIAVVDPASAGVTLRRTLTAAGTPEYTMRLDGVAAQPLGEPGRVPGDECVADLYRFTVAGACAVGDGVVAGALDLTAGHVGTRRQFGRPLASFQAVAQQIADVYVTARTLHLAVLSAGWRMSTGRPADDDLWVAAHWLTDNAPQAVRTCHHLHGGLGLDVEYPLHRYSALIRDLTRLLGGVEHCLGRLGGRVVHRPD